MSGLKVQFGLAEDAPRLRQQETALEEAAVIAKELCSHLVAWNKTLETVTEESRSLAQSLRSFGAAVASPSSAVASSSSSSSSSSDQRLCNVVSTVAETHFGYMTAQQSLSSSIQKTTSKVLEVVNRELRTVQVLMSNYERARSQFNALVICASDVGRDTRTHSSRDHNDSETVDSTSTGSNQNQAEGEEEEDEEATETTPKESLEEREAKLKTARDECKQAEMEVELRILAAINAIQLSTHDLVCCHSEEFSCFLSRLSFLVPSLHNTAAHRKWIENKRIELQNTLKPSILAASTTFTSSSSSSTLPLASSSSASSSSSSSSSSETSTIASPTTLRRKATLELLTQSVQIGSPSVPSSDNEGLPNNIQLPPRAGSVFIVVATVFHLFGVDWSSLLIVTLAPLSPRKVSFSISSVQLVFYHPCFSDAEGC